MPALPLGPIFVKAAAAVLQAMAMASIGIIFARIGVIDATAKKVLSTISMKVTIPCLLFSAILSCPQSGPGQDPSECPRLDQIISSAWPMLFFPFLWVGVGVLCGHLVVTICGPPKELTRTVIAACAFGNSTGLPIVLLTAIAQADVVQFPTTIDVATQKRGFLLLLSIYQITYPMIQWSVAGRLLVPAIAKENTDLESGQVVDLPVSLSDELSMSAPPSLSDKLRNSWATCCSQVKDLLQAFLVPPVIAVLVGTAIGAVPVLKSILVDTNDFDDDAYLEWLFDAVETVGKAAVPLNMLVLGSSLASIPSFSDIHWPSTLGVAVGKLVLYPAIVYAIMLSLHLSGVVHHMVPNQTMHRQLVVVACLVSATPTANNLTVMAEMAGGPACKRALAGMIFVMYCASPFVLTAWIVAFVSLEQIGH